MVKYLVTTRLEVLEKTACGNQVFMVDGTVPGWTPRQCDHHFDHHRQGGADIQIDEMPRLKASYLEEYSLDEYEMVDGGWEALIATTQVDADACVAAVWLQLSSDDFKDTEHSEDLVIDKLRAIAYDCDHLGVPEELSQYADFAAQCVAAMEADSDKLVEELALPRDRKTWTIEQKEEYASLAFQRGTESLIAACRGERKFPGERGEAAEYWEKVEKNTQMLLDENRVTFYRDTLLINYKGLQGTYVDPRCALKAYQFLYDNYGCECQIPVTLAQREVFIDNELKGFSYTIGCIPSHRGLAELDYTKGAFEALTEAERTINPSADGWGGRKTVGGSGWNTPSQLEPKEVIDIVLDVLNKE